MSDKSKGVFLVHMGRKYHELDPTLTPILLTECQKRTCGKNLSSLENDIREFYFSTNGREIDIVILKQLLEPKGFQIDVGLVGSTIEGITWPDMEADFKGLDRLGSELIGFNGVLDEELGTIYVPEYFSEEYADVDRDGEPIFPTMRAMDDDSIPRSKAHWANNPHEHEMKVLGLFWSDGLSFRQRFWGRLFAATHDLGKSIIAIGDHHQYHAFISYLMLREYLRSRRFSLAHMVKKEMTSLTDEQIEMLLAPVRYHHGPELVLKGIITDDELIDLVVTPDNLDLTFRLAIADAYSVEDYQRFSIGHAKVAIETLTKSYDRQLRIFVNYYREINPHATVNEIVKAAEKLRENYLDKINAFIQYMVRLVKDLPQANPWIFTKIEELHRYIRQSLVENLEAVDELGELVPVS